MAQCAIARTTREAAKQMEGVMVPLAPNYPGGCYLFFNAAINAKTMEQLVALATQAVANQFAQLTICMSSTGGDPDAAIFAYNALSALPISLSTHNIGAVQSAAVLPFLAGKQRFATPGAYLFFHQTAWNYDGSRVTEAYLINKLDMVKREDQRAAQIVADKAGRPIESIYEWQRNDLFMDNAMAIAEGLVTAEQTLQVPQNGWVVQTVT